MQTKIGHPQRNSQFRRYQNHENQNLENWLYALETCLLVRYASNQFLLHLMLSRLSFLIHLELLRHFLFVPMLKQENANGGSILTCPVFPN